MNMYAIKTTFCLTSEILVTHNYLYW